MHVLKFSTVLQNAEISLVTSLKIESTTTFHDNEVILPAILKSLGILTGKICSGVSLQYNYRWVDWTARTPRLQACIFREKRGTFAKIFLRYSKFQNVIFFRKTLRILSVVEFLVRQQTADSIRAIVIKGNFSTYVFRDSFQSIRCSYFKTSSSKYL